MKWQWAGYYGDIKSAFVGILRKHLCSLVDEEILLTDIIKQIDNAEKTILQAVKNNIDNPLMTSSPKEE